MKREYRLDVISLEGDLMGLEDWRNALRWCLAGVGSHIDPLEAVKGLSAKEAALSPPGGLHSAHRLLHHVVYWQDLILAPAAGEAVAWPAGPEDWNCLMAPLDELVERFRAGLKRAGHVASTADLAARIPAWEPEMTVGAALNVLITHNSYHTAQLVDARRTTGRWPPPKE